MTVRVLLEPPKHPHVRRRRRSRAIERFRWLLLIVGMAALGYSGYAYLDTYVYQAYEEWSFDQEAAGKTPSVAEFIRQAPLKAVAMAASGGDKDSVDTAKDKPAESKAESAKEAAPATTNDRKTAAAKRDPKLIGRIDIPRLRVRAVVKEGIDDKTLRRAVGHVPETVRPGVPGNVGLAAHRDSFFRGLRNVRKQDRIVIETLDGKYEYEVESTQIVRPKDVQVLAPTKESVLTLVTCYPFNYVGNAPKRFIVRARQVSPEPVESVETASAESGASKRVD